MKKTNELNYKDLKMVCNPDQFNFETTEELDPINTGIGQDRGIRALEFGLNVDVKGYNLYIEGPSGVGKTMYARNYLNTISKKKKVPQDWCYIYNFDNPNEPIAVSLPAGGGKEFQDLMDHFINDVKVDIKSTFNNEEFEKERALIKQEFEEKRSVLMARLNQKSSEYGFQVKSSQTGIYMMPVMNGKAMPEEEFNKLDENIKKQYEEKSTIVQQHIMEAIGEIKAIERESAKKVEEWQSNVALLTVNTHINYIKSKYKRNKKINHFLDSIKKDILKNISCFVDDGKVKQQPNVPQPKPELVKPWLNYRVNLFVDNSQTEGAPVVMDSNYSYHNIFGKLEYENYYGSLKTDYTMLKPGLLHIANGGYLIMQATDIVSNQYCYETLKKVLRTKELGIENPVDQHSSMVMVSLKPEPIPLNLKVILIGNEALYQTLISVDTDFRKLFKIKVEFEDDAPLTLENMNKLARVVEGFCQTEELPPLDRSGMAKVIEFASRLANDQTKLSTRFSEITQIVGEAATLARLRREKVITGKIVDEALAQRIERVQKYNQKYLDMINNSTLLIDTEGFKVGQINGLTVMSIGDYSFGLPARITANTYVGKNGIIDIEREVEMSGSSHSKGILILSGYLGEMFAQDMPLSLTASLCFEQLYNGVDGDSASSTELYAILSSLSGIPINQSIAVTGSVNQKGEIQPIGGVNEKIEGFFKICKTRGLKGLHGVMIPKLNEKNLNLSDEVVEAVKQGLFHIYAISTIEQGIEILTGVPAGKRDESGRFTSGSVNSLAYAKLKKYAKISKED